MKIRPQSQVIGVFPSVESYMRMRICHLIECMGNWENERSYICDGEVLGSLVRLPELMAQAGN